MNMTGKRILINKMENYIISLTSVPERFNTTLSTVIYDVKKYLKNVTVVVSIPKTYRKGWTYDLKDIKYINEVAHLNIIDEDYGPATKLLGGIEWILNKGIEVEGIITIDDDIIFDDISKQIENLLNYSKTKNNHIITTGGLKLIKEPFISGNGIFGVYNDYVHSVAGFMGVYYPKIFWSNKELFELIKELDPGFYQEDDAYFGAVAGKLNTPIWSTKLITKIKSISKNSAVSQNTNDNRIERESNLYKDLINQKIIKMDKITLVLTSCGRNDLLEKTLDSFFQWNTYPIERYIITEDSADPKVFEECERLNREKYDGKLEFIFNHEKLGQSASIDLAYSKVETEYIFHCEEDWEFYRSGFIEDSIKVLKTQPKVIQAWIRPKSDNILNKIQSKIYDLPLGVSVRIVDPASFIVRGANEDGTDMVIKNYMGFSWNPGVKRIKDWQELSNGYSGFEREHLVDQYYRDNGFMVVSLSRDDNDGYVKHIGWNRRAADPVYRK